MISFLHFTNTFDLQAERAAEPGSEKRKTNQPNEHMEHETEQSAYKQPQTWTCICI